MIKFNNTLLLVICSFICNAQTVPIVWQKNYGCQGNEVLHSICPTADGNYMVMGIADVNGGNVSCDLKGLHDIWIFKMTGTGNIIWQKCFGGSKEEANPYNMIISTSDGGSLFIAESWSNDFDAADHHKLSDVFTVKLDSEGNVEWIHSFGGKNWDVPRSILELPGQRYVIVSRSTSSDGDVPPNLDSQKFDAWVFILDHAGDIISNHIYGGTGDDDIHKALLAPDGNLLLFGFTSSQDGNLAGLNVNGTDAWLLKIDTLGNVLNSRVYGQADAEQFYDAIPASNGGYMAFGVTGNPGMPVDKGSYHGGTDFWAVKLSNNYKIQWQGVYGGGEDESLIQGVAAPNNSGYYLAGSTNSIDGDVVKQSTHGTDDYVIKIGSNGKLLWTFTHGGTKKDYVSSITTSGIVAGPAYSYDGDVLNPKGDADGWIYKFKDPNGNKINETGDLKDFKDNPDVHIFPNPASDYFTLQFTGNNDPLCIELLDVAGRILCKQSVEASVDLTQEIASSKIDNGIYILKISGKNIFTTRQIIIAH